jgi:putative ABC transport system permease protein
MQFLGIVWRNLMRRKMRTGLTIVGLSVAVAAVVALVGVSDGFSESFQKLYKRRGIDIVVQRVGSSTELNNALPLSLAEQIRKTPHVTDAIGGLMDVWSFPEHDLVAVIVNGWPPDSPLFKDQTLLEGRPLTTQDHHKVWIGKVLAANLNVKLHDYVTHNEEKLEIVGIFESQNVFEDGSIELLLSDMQQFMNLNQPPQVTGFIIRTDIPKDAPGREAKLAEIQKQIEALGEGIAAQPTTAFIEGVEIIQLARAVAWVTSAIALCIGAIGMLNTMVMSVYERVKEIGTLRAIGWRKMRVMWMILWESFFLSLGGAVVGALAALGLTHLLSKMPVTAGLVSGDVQPVIVLQGFLLALLVGFVGAIYPAYWGANLSPIEALRRK